MAQGLLKVKGVSIQSVTADPSGAADGDIIYRSDLGKFRMREGGTWKDVGSSAITWGAITGTLSDQADLQSALDNKANNSDLTDLVNELASTNTGEGASTIGVEDSSGRFTGTDVESVLAEIGLALEGLPATYLPTAGGQMSGSIDMSNQAINSINSLSATIQETAIPYGMNLSADDGGSPDRVYTLSTAADLNSFVVTGVNIDVGAGATRYDVTNVSDLGGGDWEVTVANCTEDWSNIINFSLLANQFTSILMGGSLNFNLSGKIINLPSPSGNNDAASKVYVDTTISNSLSSALGDYIQLTEKGANNGVATLDAGGKVPVSQLPSSVMEYKGTWDASTNSPTIADGSGDAGDIYVVSVSGTQDLGSGSITFSAGDWVMYNGSIWQKSVNSNAVASVNGQTGVVSLDLGDLSDVSVSSPSDGDVLTWDDNAGQWIAQAVATGANTALSNLASTAVNVSLIPGTDNSVDLGSSSLRWKDLNLSNKIVGPNNRSIDFSNASYGALESFGNDVIRWDSSGLAIGNTLSIYNNGSHSIKCIESQGIYKTIAANITTPTLISGMSYPIGTYSGAIINYTIVDTNSGRVRTGQFIVSCDASNIDFADQFVQSQVIGDVSSGGTELTAAINGSNFEIRVNRTHATNGCTLKGVLTLI